MGGVYAQPSLRDVVKFDATQLAKWHAELMQPVTTALMPRTIVPTSEDAPQAWRYTMTEPNSCAAVRGFPDENAARTQILCLKRGGTRASY
jgi:hypothetical protein